MAWIRTIPSDEAQGPLKQLFDAALLRAGRVFNIVRVQSLNPPVLKAGIGLYQAVMIGPSELSRALRELLAVVVSKTNGCHY
ncbi:MAG: carboxymuconolactone decarboxylase family protein [Phycisphaerales bacterium]|nr:carboxymuconolactone decarboxylase family protein [Phycisphaerales bacterium]